MRLWLEANNFHDIYIIFIKKVIVLDYIPIINNENLTSISAWYYGSSPRFCGQPKICRLGVPIRPIVSFSGSPLYHLNKYVVNILKGIKNENNNSKNSTTFSNCIRSIPMEDDEIMVLFDVIYLYTNINIIIIKDYVNNDDQFTRKMAISQDKLIWF